MEDDARGARCRRDMDDDLGPVGDVGIIAGVLDDGCGGAAGGGAAGPESGVSS